MKRTRVILTRPAERQRQLARWLTDAGYDVLGLPALAIEALTLSEMRQALQAKTWHAQGSDEADVLRWLQQFNPASFDCVVFVSRAAWQHYWDRFRTQLVGDSACFRDGKSAVSARPVWPHATRIACVGRSTAQAIADDLNCPCSDILYPVGDSTSDSEGLWAVLTDRLHVGQRVLIVRGMTGRPWLAEVMVAAGLEVKSLPVYRRDRAVWSARQIELLTHVNAADLSSIWVITSAESLRALQLSLVEHRLESLPDLCPEAVLVIHDRLVMPVRRWLSQWGEKAVKIPIDVCQPDDQSLFESVQRLATSWL